MMEKISRKGFLKIVGVIQIFAQCQKIAQLLDGHGVLLFAKRKFYLILIRILYLLFLCL